MDPLGKVALVTGGVRGIGLATVKELLRQGVKGVTICDVIVTEAATLVKQLNEEFGKNRAMFIRTDVSKPEEVEEAFKETIKTFGELNIVINNAGICDEKNWQRAVAVNLNGVMQGVLMALKYMGKQEGGKGGVVINMGSIAGFKNGFSRLIPIYNATKHAVVGFTQSFESDFLYQQTGVRVMAMCPGYTTTDLSRSGSELKPITYCDEWMPEYLKELQDYNPPQKPENVADGFLRMIREGKPGSVWLCRNDKPAHVISVPALEQLLK